MLQGPSRSDFHTRLAPVLRADPTRKGDTDARERNTRTRPPGQGRRQVAFHASGRIRAGRDGTRARREAWGAIHETGDRDRSVESAAVRGPAAVAPQGTSVLADSGEGLARPSKRKDGKDPSEVPQAVEGGFEGASPRGPLRRIPQVALPAGPVERPETRRRAPVCCRAQGGADPEETLLVSPPIRADRHGLSLWAVRPNGHSAVPASGYCAGERAAGFSARSPACRFRDSRSS
jgi:hypothetical protein